MLSSTTLSYFFGFWAVTYLIDTGLSSHPLTRNRYIEIRNKLGFSIHIFQARFFTTKLNSVFCHLGELEWFPWNAWFTIGTAFSAIFMCLSLLMLSFLAYNTIMRNAIEKQVITPVIPGVNLPMSHFGFYMLTLLVCIVLHEAGHALAAIREKVRLHGFGFFLLGIYPGAYVDLNDVDLGSLSPIRQLKIYAAGVWHNGVIVLISILVFYTLPWILTPVFSMNQGVGVIGFHKDSVFTGHRGLHLGDAITEVNGCPVNNPSEWFGCLKEVHNKKLGYCVPGNYLSLVDSSHMRVQPGGRKLSVVLPVENSLPSKDNLNASLGTSDQDCCSPSLASTHLCFTYLKNIISGKQGKGKKRQNYACLPVRAITERDLCSASSDCSRLSSEGDQRFACLIPAPPHNMTRLIRIVHNRLRSPAILFLGPVDDLLASLEVSDYVPRWPQITPCRLPQIVSTFCMYLFSLSGALVLLNVVPCYALDGQWILKALLDLTLPSFICARQFKRLIYSTLLSIGTALLFINIVLALLYLILELSMPFIPKTDGLQATTTL